MQELKEANWKLRNELSVRETETRRLTEKLNERGLQLADARSEVSKMHTELTRPRKELQDNKDLVSSLSGDLQEKKTLLTELTLTLKEKESSVLLLQAIVYEKDEVIDKLRNEFATLAKRLQRKRLYWRASGMRGMRDTTYSNQLRMQLEEDQITIMDKASIIDILYVFVYYRVIKLHKF